MNVERNLPVVRERKLEILKGDPELCAQQKKAGKLIARERIGLLLDAASFVELDVLNSEAGVVTGYGLINGSPVYVYAQDFTVVGGSLGEMHAKKIWKVLDLAMEMGAPVIGLNDSGGARIQEAVDALAGYGGIFYRNTRASGVVPQIAVVLGVCAGTAALQAAGADLCVVSEEAEFFFTAPFTSAAAGDVVEGAGTAALAAKAGVAALVEKDTEAAVAAAARLAGLMPANNLAGPAIMAPAEPAAWPAKYEADKAAITAALHETLPAYMIPNIFMPVDEMPMTKNGKIDRNALMELYQSRKRGTRNG